MYNTQITWAIKHVGMLVSACRHADAARVVHSCCAVVSSPARDILAYRSRDPRQLLLLRAGHVHADLEPHASPVRDACALP